MLCQNCNKQEATENWVGEGSVLDWSHGNYQRWCERCCIIAQITSAKKSMERLDKLEKRLKELTI